MFYFIKHRLIDFQLPEAADHATVQIATARVRVEGGRFGDFDVHLVHGQQLGPFGPTALLELGDHVRQGPGRATVLVREDSFVELGGEVVHGAEELE